MFGRQTNFALGVLKEEIVKILKKFHLVMREATEKVFFFSGPAIKALPPPPPPELSGHIFLGVIFKSFKKSSFS